MKRIAAKEQDKSLSRKLLRQGLERKIIIGIPLWLPVILGVLCAVIFIADIFIPAIRLERVKAALGFGEAQYYLGLMYYEGKDIPQDYAQAAYWLLKGATQGNADAQNKLGAMYANGTYGELIYMQPNYTAALNWWRKAAEQGNAASQKNLGYMYQNGLGAPDDKAEAEKWYKKAAQAGDLTAQFILGFAFHDYQELPNKEGTCVRTQIDKISTRLESNGEPVFGSGSSVHFINGGYQVSSEEIASINHSIAGDSVLICLIANELDCAPNESQGHDYITTNLRTMESWQLPESSHQCHGA